MRGLFAAVGVVFLGIGVIFGPVRAISSEPRVSRAAAEAFAAGEIALRNADTPAENAIARRHFDRAIRERPGFAPAYLSRSEATFAESSTQLALAPSLTTPTARRAEINDLRMAQALGLQSPNLLTSLGFGLIALGLEDGKRDLIDEGFAVTEQAVAEYAKSDPAPLVSPPKGKCRGLGVERLPSAIPLFNLGVAELARGRVAAARAAYERAICASLAHGSANDLLSGALTDLELVAAHGPLTVQNQIVPLKELIVGSAGAGVLRAAGPRAELRGTSIFVEAGSAQFTIPEAEKLPDSVVESDDSKDWLSVNWYYQDPGDGEHPGLGWSHLEQLSGPTQLEGGPHGSLTAQRSYVEVALSRCLPNGRYRVELYHRGRLVGQGEAEYSRGRRLIAFHDEIAGVVGCRPAQWTPTRRGLAAGFVSRDKTQGLFVTRLAGVPASAFIDEPKQALPLVRQAIRRWGGGLGALKPEGSSDGLYLDLARMFHWFEYRGGEVMSGVGRDSDGSVVISVVYGPREYFQVEDEAGNPRAAQLVGSPEPEEIMDSLQPVDLTAGRG